MKTILVIEDEPDIRAIITSLLESEGFEVITASTGAEAMIAIEDEDPHLVLVDILLPDISGLEICRRLRAQKDRWLPIVILSALQDTTDKVLGLDCGADDYITKPFDCEEFIARIRARLRCVGEITQQEQTLKVGDLTVDLTARRVLRGGKCIRLTRREYDILEILTRNAGHVLTKDCIFERVWGYDTRTGWNGIKVYINYLRTKLNAEGKTNLIHAVRGVGYVLHA